MVYPLSEREVISSDKKIETKNNEETSNNEEAGNNEDNKQEEVKEIKLEEHKTKDSNLSKEIKVKYSLNKVKNLEVAKANTARSFALNRIISDDINTRYELNSGLYLVIKDKMKTYKKGDVETTKEIDIIVEKNTAVIDNLKNNPETQVKITVKNNETNEKSNVMIKLYHTNQSIHLQGGKRMGNVTSTSLVADLMEAKWRMIMKECMINIIEINGILKNMPINANMNLRSRTSSGDQILYCDKCSYTTPLKHKMTTHKMSFHGAFREKKVTIKTIPLKRKSSPNKSLEVKKVVKQKVTKEALKEAISAVTEQKDQDISNKQQKEALKEAISPDTDEKDQDISTNQQKEVGLNNNQCTDCGFFYNSKKELSAHIVTMHKTESHHKPITIQQVDNILTDMAKKEAEKNDSREVEEFLDEEKEKFKAEVENLKKVVIEIDLDLKSALKANEKLIKEKLFVQEDYDKCARAAGHLQERVHTLGEEVKEVNQRSELDKKEKEQA